MSKMSICRKNNWSVECENMVNDQINMELYASHYYNALYSYFLSDSVGFPKMADYFKKSSDEETEHARKFIEYQNIRGGTVQIKNIQTPTFNFDENSGESVLYQALNIALSLEQKVYESILKMSKTCEDPAYEDFLDDFLKEQLEGQHILGMKLRQLKHIGKDGHGLVHFSEEMLN